MAEVSQTTDAEKKRKEKENVVTTCSNYKVSTSLYVFGRKISLRINKQVLDKFHEIARLEGLSASKLAEHALTEYGLRHGKGNPQLPLTPYVDARAPSPVQVLCYLHLAGVTNEGQIYCRKHGGAWIPGIRCYSCNDNQFRKKKGVSS